ncbi:energy transducer TonB [Hymenobacter sp. CRA2]|uniref:energy transducer TonB n=1 Tax=Hymenobacter sp. CRA2 TaxID=1955620 RepID=UPI00098FAF67|nr:energy transducer TonB [Hymenobacter sp. CRA2]OON70164.1 energy transducer TonB [Hymenobacter sp. CRA2]
MKKTTFALAMALMALAAAPALAQQKVKVKTKTEGDAPAPDAPAAQGQDPVTKIATAAPKAIPVAEYYEGGQEAMYEFIYKELKYPLLARRNRIQGTCIVSFTLNPDGTMSGVKLVKQVGGGTGEEALRLVKLLQFKKPEYPILTSLPISFKIGPAGANTAE